MAIIYGNVFDLQQNNGIACTHYNRLIEAILMSTYMYNLQFRNKIRKILSIFITLSYRKKSVGTQNEFE